MLMVLRAKTTLNYKKYKGKNTLRMCLSSAVCCAIPSAFPLSRLLEYCWGWHHAALRENSLLGPWHRTEISARRHKNLGMLRGWERGVSPRTVLGSRHLVRALWVRWEENRVLGPAGLFRVCITLCSPHAGAGMLPCPDTHDDVCEPAGTSTAAGLSRDMWMLWDPVEEEAPRHPAARSPCRSCWQMVLMFEKPKPGFLQARGIPRRAPPRQLSPQVAPIAREQEKSFPADSTTSLQYTGWEQELWADGGEDPGVWDKHGSPAAHGAAWVQRALTASFSEHTGVSLKSKRWTQADEQGSVSNGVCMWAWVCRAW